MVQLNGAQLADYIKERQAKEVRRLKQAHGIQPALAIIQDHPDPVIDTYVQLKSKYADDIGAVVESFLVNPAELPTKIKELNRDEKYQGIIVQLPLSEPSLTKQTVNQIDAGKDVDGLGEKAGYPSATAQAIMWLMAGYGIEPLGKKLVIIGQGRLVGAPLARLLSDSGVEPIVIDSPTTGLAKTLETADIVISATGQPGMIKSEMVKPGAAVIDAGTASEGGTIRGDASDELYERDDISITPKRGGVGPLTVASLFDNLLRASRARIAAP